MSYSIASAGRNEAPAPNGAGFEIVQQSNGLAIRFADDRYSPRERHEIADAASTAARAKLSELLSGQDSSRVVR